MPKGLPYSMINAVAAGNVAMGIAKPVVISAGAVSDMEILTIPTSFLLKPASPNLGGFWDDTLQEFRPPPGIFQINGALACVSTNNNADATLMMMLNGAEFARVTAGAVAGNIMSCTLGLAFEAFFNDVISFKMFADRDDMVVMMPG